MKKLINLAVAVIMMTLCTVILGACSGSEIEGDQPVRPVDPTVDEVLRNNCTENVVNTYTSDNAEIKTRSVVVPQGNYEALISAKSVHQFIVDILYKEDVPVKQDSVAYTVTNTVKGYGLKKTRFARSVKVFETWKEESKTLEDGRVVRAYTFNGEQGGEVFKLSTIDEQTCSDESVTIQGATFEDLCKNHWTDRKLVKVEPVYLEQDSADYKWYRIDFIFNDALAYGTDSKGTDNRKVEFTMHGEKVWIAKEGTNPPIPDDPEEVIAYTAKEKGFEFVKDSISAETGQKITVSKAWIQFEKLLSTGETKLSYRPEVLLYCRVDTPAIQTPVNVSDFEIKNLEAEKYSKIAYGDKEERGKNVFVQKYGQKMTTKTNKAQFIFDGKSEEATCVDSLGIEHQFEFRTWDFVDLGTKLTDMEPQDGKERKLLTSTISATFNKRSAEYKGEAELIKLKDGQKKAGIDIINERPKIDGDKVVIEFDKENRYNDGSKDTIFNLTFDPNYRVTVEDPIAVKNRDYARKSNEAVKKLVKKEKTEVGTFTWQACQYSNTFEYVGFNNALQAYVPESVLYTDEDGLSDEVKIPAWTLNWVKFAKSSKNEGDTENQMYSDTIHYQFKLAETVTPIKPKQLLRATLSGSDPTDPSAIRYEYGPKAYKKVDAQTIFVYRDKYAIYDDGTKKEIGQVGHNVTFYVTSPTDQEIVVDNLNISKLDPSFGSNVKGNVTTDGPYTITNYTKEAVTKTQKSNQVFVGHSQEIIYTDEFGQEVDFNVFEWQFSEVSGIFSDLANDGNYQRKLFTSTISGRFVDANNYVGKVIFKKSQTGGDDKDISYYIYSDKGMREVGDSTYTYMTQIPVYKDGSKGVSNEIGVNIGRKAQAPAKQVKEVTDFNITESSPSTGSKTSNGKTRYNKGFKIEGYSTSYTTRSNKVTYVFGFESEEAVYIDEFGHEEAMKHSDWSFVNKNIKSEALSDQDGYKRYSSNSTIEASYNGVKTTLIGEAELKMKAAKTLKSVEYGNHGIDFKSGNTWNAWQEYTKIYSDNSRENAKKSVDLNYIVNPQASKDQIASEANAPYTGLTSGSSNSTTRSGGQNITVTTTNTVYTENYTIFNDTYTAVSEKAVYSEVEDGVEIKFNFDFVEIGNVAHSSDNLSNANQTKVVDGITYDIHAHTGVLGYSVASKNFTATCYTNVLVAQPVNPNVPESWGRVKGVAGHTLVFDPDFGTDGRFRDCWVINFENGKWVVLDNDWNDTSSFFGWDKCYNDNRLRSAVKFDDGTYFPSTCTIDGTGWSYVGEKIGGGSKVVDMSQQRALLAGIKNFTGDSTAEVTPERGGWGQASGNTLKVYTKDGLLVKTIITK